MSLSVALWAATVIAFAAAFAWVFRRFVALFAALEAVERIEENAPTRANDPAAATTEKRA